MWCDGSNGAGDGTEEEGLQVKYDCCGIYSNIRVSSEAEGYGKYNASNDDIEGNKG